MLGGFYSNIYDRAEIFCHSLFISMKDFNQKNHLDIVQTHQRRYNSFLTSFLHDQRCDKILYISIIRVPYFLQYLFQPLQVQNIF